MEENKKRYVIDTSFLIAYYHPLDANFHQAEKIAEQKELGTSKRIINDLVIEEFITVATYKFGIDQAQIMREEFMKEQDREKQKIDSIELAQEHFKNAKKISLADTSLIVCGRETQAELITFDTQLKKYRKTSTASF